MKEVVLIFPKPWPGTGMAGRIPYSLLHLISYLKGEDFKISIVDERIVGDVPSYIERSCSDILCFGISSFTGVQINYGLDIARRLKARYPGAPIVWGGWHPTCVPEQTLRHPLVDIVVRGQGEETLRQLLRAMAHRTPLSDVKGLSYKDKDELVHNPDRELLPILERLKLSYDAIDVEPYIHKQPWGDRSIGLITSLGCPFACGFCAIANVYKRRTIFRNIDQVLAEIDYLVDKYRINAFTLDDDNFFVSPRRVEEFCHKLIKKPYRLTWDAGAHVGLLLKHYDDDALRLIRESGCEQLYIGAESGSDEVLDLIEKKAHVSDTFEYVRRMRSTGIRSFLSTMVCLPGVSSDDIHATMEMIIKCRAIDPSLRYRLFYYTPYPGTPLYRKAVEMGMREPESLLEWSNHTLRKFKAPWIKKSDRRMVRQFYFYYFPYSAETLQMPLTAGWPLAKKLLFKAYALVFANGVLTRMAKWRVRKGNFKYALDAWFVVQGERLKSWYSRLVYKTPGEFADYED